MQTQPQIPAERAAARIREMVSPTHADYQRIINEEYARVDPDVCHICSKHEEIGIGLMIQECHRCDLPTCSDCAEVDYDFVGDLGSYRRSQWDCETCLETQR